MLDGDSGSQSLSPCVSRRGTWPMPRNCRKLCPASCNCNQIARDTVTLVLDKGSAALANTLELDQAAIGWISALPWKNQAPVELRETETWSSCPSAAAHSRACAPPPKKMLVHGKEYLCVVKYSASFAVSNSTRRHLPR